ncbi:MAG: nitroreductase [Gammaproteobacteria bacterium]|nr:nitroreductase [Gammaproteobacteria bacterium]NND38718.1 nitroreductase [Pseudomonadales bacterium]MBT8152192.1 nitroreductase [Gammaproteobacteria bacterium]NNL10778.1 nitroreductase [Pseudomonadales bacterium]NNM12182.1 nitroreductase [Pseudomonadales bacterium]
MDAITALHSRVSHPRLAEPAPTGVHREAIFQAALRAPDHAAMRGWRFYCVEGSARAKLGKKMLAAALRRDPDMPDAARSKRLKSPLRAPLLVIATVLVREHPKVPEIEQWLSAGAAVNNMLLAAHALGYGAMWRTGALSFDRSFMTDIGLEQNQHIVGFIYLGSAPAARKQPPVHHSSDYFLNWT